MEDCGRYSGELRGHGSILTAGCDDYGVHGEDAEDESVVGDAWMQGSGEMDDVQKKW